MSVATAGNDHRLGANEAPPAVVSMFLGDELTAHPRRPSRTRSPTARAEKTVMKLGVHVLPQFIRDTTDRNRTSPFAFTGNKFEFRMLGSSNSIACANIMLNAAVAAVAEGVYADQLEGAQDFDAALHAAACARRSPPTSASSSTATAMTTPGSRRQPRSAAC